jgi:hypothetical protein
MKRIIILGLSAAVITSASLTASAWGDEQYPAANFQPKVIYIDKDSVKTLATSQCQCPTQKSEEKTTEFDPKYPAANFVPKVIYP